MKASGPAHPMFLHGHNLKGQRSPEYRAWAAARNRCNCKSNAAYDDYGGRGITFTGRWDSFAQFLKDMGPRPAGTTLERQDNSKGYAATNCYWATKKAQARNRRSNRLVTLQGIERSIAEWCEVYNIRLGTVLQRLSAYGWSEPDAIQTPVIRKNRK
jgi:hypothetical protein